MEATEAIFLWDRTFCPQDSSRVARVVHRGMEKIEDSSRTQMRGLVLMEAIEAIYSWKTVRTLSRTNGNMEGYVPFLLLHYLMLIRRQSRPATEDDILRLCQSFHNLTREFIQEVMGELRRGNARRGNQENYTADDEADGDVPRRRLRKPRSKFPGIRRRPAEQNALSVFL